jgi:hypothetical protein
MSQIRVRFVAFMAAALLLLSWVFPIGAGLAKDTSHFPKWWGPADVTLAFVLVIAVFALQFVAGQAVDQPAKDATYRVYRILLHGLLAVGVLVMVAGDRITWINCATGFLWRTWLALYILPWWLSALAKKVNMR